MSSDETDSRSTRAAVTVLNGCIETCTDGEKGYATAAADVRDVGLKSYFQGKSEERADFVVALQEAISALSAVPENEGSTAGALHRGFVGIRKALEGRSDALVLEECLRGEKAALAAYEKAIAHASLDVASSTLRALLVHQRDAITRSVAELQHRLGGH